MSKNTVKNIGRITASLAALWRLTSLMERLENIGGRTFRRRIETFISEVRHMAFKHHTKQFAKRQH